MNKSSTKHNHVGYLIWELNETLVIVNQFVDIVTDCDVDWRIVQTDLAISLSTDS